MTKEASTGPLSVPSARRSCSKAMSPESNSSISGFTPASVITLAIRRTLAGVLMTTALPEYMVLRSRVQMSGFSAAIWATRSSGGSKVVPGAATFGSSAEGTKRPPGPVVMLRITSGLPARMRRMVSS